MKRYALERNLEVLQPESLRSEAAQSALVAHDPDIIIVAAYGLILPQEVLDIPKAGCLNVHASLLPRWRGAAPVQAAILAGDSETGVCLMAMRAGLDSGPVYACEALPIDEEITAGELQQQLAILGGELLVGQLPDILNGELEARDQDERFTVAYGDVSDLHGRVLTSHRSRRVE